MKLNEANQDLDQRVNERPIILIDAANLFLRHFCANPSISAHGSHVGGVVGFMNALKVLVIQNVPTNVIVIWEGGGSLRRRQLYPEYKQNRKPAKMNRFYDTDIPDTVENRNDQIKTLIACLKCVPVCQVYVQHCEADDVVAYLTRTKFRERKTIIVSSDKDFYQLLNDNVRIFRLGKKTFVTKQDMFNEYNIMPKNFALAKALCGDASDNIPGVHGVGFKTLSKRFSKFSLDDEYELNDLLSECRTLMVDSKLKVYSDIAAAEDIIRRNLKLVDLDGGMLNHEQRSGIDYVVDTFEPTRSKINLIRECVKHGLNDFNIDEFFHAMGTI